MDAGETLESKINRSEYKILIVDDDENIAELIYLYLTKECYECRIVGNGEDAIKAVKEKKVVNLLIQKLLLEWKFLI